MRFTQPDSFLFTSHLARAVSTHCIGDAELVECTCRPVRIPVQRPETSQPPSGVLRWSVQSDLRLAWEGDLPCKLTASHKFTVPKTLTLRTSIARRAAPRRQPIVDQHDRRIAAFAGRADGQQAERNSRHPLGPRELHQIGHRRRHVHDRRQNERRRRPSAGRNRLVQSAQV